MGFHKNVSVPLIDRIAAAVHIDMHPKICILTSDILQSPFKSIKSRLVLTKGSKTQQTHQQDRICQMVSHLKMLQTCQ